MTGKLYRLVEYNLGGTTPHTAGHYVPVPDAERDVRLAQAVRAELLGYYGEGYPIVDGLRDSASDLDADGWHALADVFRRLADALEEEAKHDNT